ncbi:hypothetical protein ZHAS_00014482 [Anopheles sinensis]|uniref:Uncharacterized protein n=1 Tax=Anopheles sinensis TaxID=74873 RepID=A0A084W8E9_ANOSI|nr:hypothetical protein ZHAS_00014482 [Anopheles sinensis]
MLTGFVCGASVGKGGDDNKHIHSGRNLFALSRFAKRNQTVPLTLHHPLRSLRFPIFPPPTVGRKIKNPLTSTRGLRPKWVRDVLGNPLDDDDDDDGDNGKGR